MSVAEIKTHIEDLSFDYDRMSSSGQITYDLLSETISKRIIDLRFATLRELVDVMYWDFDRLSTSGKETLDKLAERLGL